MFVVAATAGLMIISHASTIVYVQTGWEGGVILVIILSLLNTAGRLLGGILSDKVGRISYLRLILIVPFINLILFRFYNTPVLIILGCLIVGYCYGGIFSVFPAFVADLYGRENYGVNYGIIFTAFGVGGTIGPMVAARIFDKTGNYLKAYIVAAILLGLGFIVSLTFNERNR